MNADYWINKKAEEFAEVMKFGTPYREENEAGYVYKGERFRTWLRGPRIVGAQYKADTCGCDIPPWQLCKEDCTARI